MAKISQLREQNRQYCDEFEAAYLAATDDLLAQALPCLSPEAVDLVAEITGVEGLLTTSEVELEREECRREIEEIESDPLYQEKDSLLCPDTGEIGNALEQLRQHRKALEPVLRICLENPRFIELLESGYGTPAYGRPFWRMAYHVDRKAAKEIEARCKGKPWVQIRQDVLAAIEASSVLDERIRSLTQRAKKIENLVKNRSQLLSRLRRLEQIWLATGRWRVRRALEAEPDEMLARLGRVPAWREAAKRWRLRLEVKREMERLRADYLLPAQVALDDGDGRKVSELLEEYESRQNRLLAFSRAKDKAPAVDWQSVFYG